jgi:hypothetical protein
VESKFFRLDPDKKAERKLERKMEVKPKVSAFDAAKYGDVILDKLSGKHPGETDSVNFAKHVRTNLITVSAFPDFRTGVFNFFPWLFGLIVRLFTGQGKLICQFEAQYGRTNLKAHGAFKYLSAKLKQLTHIDVFMDVLNAFTIKIADDNRNDEEVRAAIRAHLEEAITGGTSSTFPQSDSGKEILESVIANALAIPKENITIIASADKSSQDGTRTPDTLATIYPTFIEKFSRQKTGLILLSPWK